MVQQARPFNTWDLVKILGLLLMFVDHSGVFFFREDEQTYYIRAIGRGAAPVFLFLAGYASNYAFQWPLFIAGSVLWLTDVVLGGTLLTRGDILFLILISRAIFHWYEKRGRTIAKPYDWVMGGLVLFPTLSLIEYGSLGFLIALAGYMARHKTHYPAAQCRNILALAFLANGFFLWGFADPPFSGLLTLLSMGSVFLILTTLTLKPLSLPAPLSQPLKLVSRYSLYIYAGHLFILKLMTGIIA